MAKKEAKKLCFVVGPIGGDDSDERIHADWLLDGIIEPVFSAHFHDFEVKRADKIAEPGRMDAQVITALLDADLVVADLTTLNPNAFYEIGIRHMTQKPIIHMRLENQPIPFDIASFRTLSFSRKRPQDLELAQGALKAAVDAVLADGYEVDNPVTFTRGKVKLAESATPAEKIFQDQLDAILSRVSALERPESAEVAHVRFGKAGRIEPQTYTLGIQGEGPEAPGKIQAFIDRVMTENFKWMKVISDGSDLALVEVRELPSAALMHALKWEATKVGLQIGQA
ncbi:MAG: hypothetical protein J0H99_04455 [Rhodospirillales bacterium]|nr:hypothetical protein [Rhodospirillales bacterium]